MTDKKYQTFKEFYPYYLKEHSNKTNRILHFIGTLLVIVFLLAGFLTKKYSFFYFMPIAGYGFAWLGHLLFEKNKPATFTYPIWSLLSDFLMFYHICTGQLNKKLNS